MSTLSPLSTHRFGSNLGKVANKVQEAAARLGYALRFHGVKAKNIRQFIILPPKGFKGDKLGLDDLLVETTVNAEQLHAAILKTCAKPSAFPAHPNPREYVNKKLRKSRMSREQLQGLATSILCDLDANGSRLFPLMKRNYITFPGRPGD